MRLCKLATCNLNQWALDFDGNTGRIIESITQAKELGARYRVGPELEVPGYGCEDHFLEVDTVTHSWESLAIIVEGGHTAGILCDFGLPAIHAGVRYNCRVLVLDGQVVLVRPKLFMADDGNYRERRWFTAWKGGGALEEFKIPPTLAKLTGQKKCPFGDAYLELNDTSLAPETCEELFTPASPHIKLALRGVEIISNGSGSHHELRKLNKRLDLIKSATNKSGGVYLYANQQGCDGGRLYYDGCACACINGELVAQGTQFSLRDVEVITTVVDLDKVVSFRGAIASLQQQASEQAPTPAVAVDFDLCGAPRGEAPCKPISAKIHLPEEEIAYGPGCWLWDYLRRSGAIGFLLPLSGGADSSSTAAIVGAMCQLAARAAAEGDEQVTKDVRRICQLGEGEALPSHKEMAAKILHTVYMGTVNSSGETLGRSKRLAEEIGAYFLDVRIDSLVTALTSLFTSITGKVPKFKSDGGSIPENLALQNIQARLRMVLAFLLAQLVPWSGGRQGFLLVLGSANVDEGLRGYMTKYDCSSADINPIGGISKGDLRRFLVWASKELGYESLSEVEAAPPTAELEPLKEGAIAQTDEEDMGMSYEELGIYGRLRKMGRCGPVSMFRSLLFEWDGRHAPAAVAWGEKEKVKKFFRFYSINRHKMTTLTPSYHAEAYSPDDNRFDLRQFLYNTWWPFQFRKIDELVREAEAAGAAEAEAEAEAEAAPRKRARR